MISLRWFSGTIAAFLIAFATASQTHAQLPPSGGDFGEHLLEGVLKPFQDTNVATTEIGIVKKMLVQPGDRVHMGQAIAELDTDSLAAQLRVKQAEAAAHGKLVQAEEELRLQQSRLERLRTMLAKGTASVLEVERAESEWIIAKGRATFESEQAQILSLELARTESMLADRIVRSPCDGIVVEVFKKVGEYVASNSPNLIRVVDVSRLKASFSLSEQELVGLEVGQPMMVQLATGKTVKGVIEFIPPVADPSSGWFLISVIIDNADEKITGSRCRRVR